MTPLTQLLSSLKRAAKFKHKYCSKSAEVLREYGGRKENKRLQPIIQAQQDLIESLYAAIDYARVEIINYRNSEDYHNIVSVETVESIVEEALAYAAERLGEVCK